MPQFFNVKINTLAMLAFCIHYLTTKTILTQGWKIDDQFDTVERLWTNLTQTFWFLIIMRFQISKESNIAMVDLGARSLYSPWNDWWRVLNVRCLGLSERLCHACSIGFGFHKLATMPPNRFNANW